MSNEIELVIDAKMQLGEGPCWDWRNNMLYYVDIEGKKIHMYNPSIDKERVLQLKHQVSAIVPSIKQDTRFVITLENGFHTINIEKNELRYIADPEQGIEDNRFNDGKCDAFGRFWCGTMNRKNKSKHAALYCLDKEGNLTKKVEDLTISNGLTWSCKNDYLFLIDTPSQKVTRYEFDLETAKLGKAKDVIDFSKELGSPDGMTIDKEGMLWIAHFGGGRVSRWNPNNGEKLSEIVVPAPNVTSCTFGGKLLDELYITTARNGLDEKQLEKYPLSGGLFKVKLDVQGLKAHLYHL
ncbi:SMP-30/gluconolactonase/LRE family protein [Bacillus sp. B1-b2]|uniref:SMP-30/gluconolactonase/LRE family protein n=1 Tax=Bacillus sp. B1-b2 TaxID=2653201 RepID=UPI0012623D44|nr:SMP-30/gluconolactonase/LRE family protein [Bacillus sp. B1-b2]KAB7668852.1 SMP-30/gluconolactonase/LRE family protein [Bacillus sp. B1-b2]